MLPLEAARGDRTKILTFADVWEDVGDDGGVGVKLLVGLLRLILVPIYLLIRHSILLPLGLPKFSILSAVRRLVGEFFVLAVRLLKLCILLPLLVIGYLPPLIYRITFKATAVAYAPFVWVAHTTLQNPLSLKVRLERITKGELEKVRRAFSWIIIATLLGKLGLVWGLVDRSRIVDKFPSQKFVESLVVIDLWPWWQITLGADALLTFFLLYFADAALARVDSQRVWQEETVVKTLSTVAFLRAALSVITMSHFFYVALISLAPAWALRLLS